MTMPIGRKGQVYMKKEVAYGEEEVLAAENAVRHVEIAIGYNPFNRVTSPEKKISPGPAVRFDRKMTAELSNFVALLRPGGVLNTKPEVDPILEAAFGSLSDVTLATTVEAAPAPTTTEATVADAGTLAAGDMVLIEVDGEDKSPFVRMLTDVTGAALTWSPALPAAPTAGDALKAGITYKLTTDLAVSLTIAHYTDKKRILLGAGVDSLTFAFDANEEPRITATGPGAQQLTDTGQAKPAAFTTIGGNPPSGLIGDCLIDGGEYLIKTMEIAITNALLVRNQEYGVNKPTELYRQGRREITIGLEAFAETEATLYDKAEAGTNVEVLKQTGRTEGNIVAIYAPRVEFTVPEQDDPDEEINWTFAGTALETVDNKNDELYLALL